MLIAYQKLSELTGFTAYETFQQSHKEWVQEALMNSTSYGERQAQWTESIAVGSKNYTEMIKEKLGQLAKGRKIFENDGGFQLREKKASYIANFDTQKDDIVDPNSF